MQVDLVHKCGKTSFHDTNKLYSFDFYSAYADNTADETGSSKVSCSAIHCDLPGRVTGLRFSYTMCNYAGKISCSVELSMKKVL